MIQACKNFRQPLHFRYNLPVCSQANQVITVFSATFYNLSTTITITFFFSFSDSSVYCKKCHLLSVHSSTFLEMPPPASVHKLQTFVFLHHPEYFGGNPTQWRAQEAKHRAVPGPLGWYGIHGNTGRAHLWCREQSQGRKCCQTCSVNSHSFICLGPQSIQCAESAGKMSWTLCCQGIAASAAHWQLAETRFCRRWDHCICAAHFMKVL